ncbi:MAG: hypothetical protein U0838_13005 [Chloroflexota bacterium]
MERIGGGVVPVVDQLTDDLLALSDAMDGSNESTDDWIRSLQGGVDVLQHLNPMNWAYMSAVDKAKAADAAAAQEDRVQARRARAADPDAGRARLRRAAGHQRRAHRLLAVKADGAARSIGGVGQRAYDNSPRLKTCYARSCTDRAWPP